jgi:beta-hydroxylase
LNQNDVAGVVMMILIFTFILCLFMSVYRYSKGQRVGYWLIASLTILVAIIVGFRHQPLVFLYMPSSVLSLVLRTPEILDRKRFFPHHRRFESPSSFSKIKQEVSNMLEKTNGGQTLTLTHDTYSGQNAYIGSDIKSVNGVQRGWRLLNIKVGETYSPDSIHFPHLVSLLEKTPEIKSCVVSVLEPGIRIPIHVGYYKGIMRYMIPTHVPQERDKVFLCVNGKKYNWTEGEGVLWDDTFAHKVYNNSDEIRVVVYMDVVRPLPIGNRVNNFLIDMVTGSSIVKDEVKRTEIQVAI